MNILFTLVIFCCSLFGCGGGSSTSVGMVSPDRSGIMVGYYGDSDGQIAATSAYTNLAWIEGWGAGDDVLDRHTYEAYKANMRIMLAVCWNCGAENMRWEFGVLRANGSLANVVALYPRDEPDVAGMSDAAVRSMVALVRSVAAEFKELNGVKIAVIYGAKGTPGIDVFDLVGRDNYGPDQPVVLPLRANQQLLIISGGANPWQENPQPFVDYAEAHPEVWGVIFFIYKYPNNENVGINFNGEEPVYCVAGRRLIQRPGIC